MLTFRPSNVDELRAEYEQNLRRGRAFVVGPCPVGQLEACDLTIVHPETAEELTLAGEVVWIKSDDPGAGAGLALLIDPEKLGALEAFVNREPDQPRAESREGGGEGEDERGPESGPEAARKVSLHERIRKLAVHEREQVARQGQLAQRVALERCFGSSVWEGLLQNPQITTPEVARIAKNGCLPVPLVAVIVANGAWVNNSEIQRALLSNPRVSGQHLDRVLRAMPHADLVRVQQQSAYRPAVKQAAKRLLG